MKVSLHEQGGYRLAFTKEFHPKIQERSEKFRSRTLAVWSKPLVSKDKADLILSICFPTDNLMSNAPPSSAKKPYLILQAPESGRAVNVGFFLSGAPADRLEKSFSKYGKAFCHWDFRDGTSISMVAWESDFDRSSLPKVGANSDLVPLTDSGKIDLPEHQSDLTALAWNDPGLTGALQMTELGGVSLTRRAKTNEH